MEFSFLTGALAQQDTESGILSALPLFFMIFFIMWFIVIRPQRKEQKERQKMLEALKKGDQVVTHGGIVGKVVRIKDDRIEIKVDESNNTKIHFLRSAVLSILAKSSESDSPQ